LVITKNEELEITPQDWYLFTKGERIQPTIFFGLGNQDGSVKK
tara:strand:+ start:295 stop:423 length:129 start_codon:yes stop_codon:yes gene_type:complete